MSLGDCKIISYFFDAINRESSNISGTLVSNKIVDHWMTSSFSFSCSTYVVILYLTPDFKGWAKATARRDEKHWRVGIWCDLY